jgi:hypothetical protein
MPSKLDMLMKAHLHLWRPIFYYHTAIPTENSFLRNQSPCCEKSGDIEQNAKVSAGGAVSDRED